jgi:hypothetical protein
MRKRNHLNPVPGLYIVCIIVCLTSCRKWIEPERSPVLMEKKKVFDSDLSATAAMNGVYAQSVFGILGMCNGGLSVYGGLLADDIVNNAANANADPFAQNSLLPTNNIVSTNFWAPAYRNLYAVNAILEGLQETGSLSAVVKKQLTGEALLFRSFLLFYLVNLFGDIPLVTVTDYKMNAVLPRSSVTVVYEQLTNDLLYAKELLSVDYPAPGKLRPNKYAAMALLARVYVYRKQWANAIAEATDVINAGPYSLVNNLATVFLPASNEGIWLMARQNSNTAEGTAFIPASAVSIPAYRMRSSLVRLFDAGDLRLVNWTRKNTVAGVSYYYPFKYKERTGAVLNENIQVLRLAEQYLLRAEAHIALSRTADGIADVNRIRRRAGLTDINTTDSAIAMDMLMLERRREFFCEWGQRWFDLKRTGKVDMVLTAEKPAWKPYAALLPVPQLDIDRNPYLKQNPGY